MIETVIQSRSLNTCACWVDHAGLAITIEFVMITIVVVIAVAIITAVAIVLVNVNRIIFIVDIT